MNSTKLLLCLTLVVLGLVHVSAKCGTCRPADCDPDDIEDCTGGTVMDLCNCCLQCAGVLGDECGGEPGSASDRGTCGEGLECVKTTDKVNKCMYKKVEEN